jgi:hypothetical protein
MLKPTKQVSRLGLKSFGDWKLKERMWAHLERFLKVVEEPRMLEVWVLLSQGALVQNFEMTRDQMYTMNRDLLDIVKEGS